MQLNHTVVAEKANVLEIYCTKRMLLKQFSTQLDSFGVKGDA